MGIEPIFNKKDIDKYLRKTFSQIEDAIEKRLIRLGVECQNIAKEQGSYTDQTANLRNSCGFTVYRKGKKSYSFYEASHSGSKESDADPLEAGESLADDVASKISADFVLVVVAGMEYASHVENMGYNVLETAEQYAEKRLPEMLERLRVNLTKV